MNIVFLTQLRELVSTCQMYFWADIEAKMYLMV